MFWKTVEHEMKGLARLKIDNYILLLNFRVKCIPCKHNEMILRNIILILVAVFLNWWYFIIFIVNLLSSKCIEAYKRLKIHALVKCKHHYSEKMHDLLWSTNKSTTMYRAGIATLSIILKLMVGRVFALVAYYCCWNYWRCASTIQQIFHNWTKFVIAL